MGLRLRGTDTLIMPVLVILLRMDVIANGRVFGNGFYGDTKHPADVTREAHQIVPLAQTLLLALPVESEILSQSHPMSLMSVQQS